MAWNFKRRVKIIPGVHLNFSSRGISTSIGPRGANITIGHSGTYLNTNIPGLGISNRQRLSGRHPQNTPPPLPLPATSAEQGKGNIYSADIHEITSRGMQGIKEAILLARAQRLSLAQDLAKIKSAARITKIKHIMSYLFIYGLVKKDIPQALSADLMAQREAIEQTKAQIEASYVDLDVNFAPALKQQYDALLATFAKLGQCHRIWDVTSAHYQDRAITRSSASTVVKRSAVGFGIKPIPEFRTNVQALYFQNANGADLYIYPSFIVMYSANSDFAIIGLDELHMQQSYVRFTETQGVPADASVIDRTWAKVNKNGSPDRRFKGNYQIPVVRYGEIVMKTATGLHEEYQFSNYEATEAFGRAFSSYQATVKRLTHLPQ